MKKIILLSVLFMALAAGVIAQGATIDYKITSTKGATGTIKVYYSAVGSRMEMQMTIPAMPGGGFSRTTIVKSDKPMTVYSLDEKTKTYTTSEMKQPAPTNADEYAVKIIGKEKVGTYNCTHATVTKGTDVTEYWTTTEISEYEKYIKSNDNKYMGSKGEYDALVKKGAGGFVVKTVTKDARGGDFTMELVKLEKKEVPASMFEIPADYKVSGAPAGIPGGIDINKIQNMTPEERVKYIEEMKKQYGTPPQGGH